MDVKQLMHNLDALNLTDLNKFKGKLITAEKVFASYSIYKNIPSMLLADYEKLTEMVESARAKNPNSDLSIYDGILQTMRQTMCYIQNLSEVENKQEYKEGVIHSQTRIIADLQSELQEYRGIESAILNGTLMEKISTILKKMKL